MKRKISIAPMMDYTDRHFRYLARILSPNSWLYTEMVHAGAIIFGDRKRFLTYDVSEHPIAIQLGGNDPRQLAKAAKIAVDTGFDEVNLNVGCPSSRVQKGQFGACLLKQPKLVAECIAAMQAVVNVPVTVKTRLGVDEYDDLNFLIAFIETVKDVGCQTFILHARKAWLKGLNPKQNRHIPPVDYERVYQIKKFFPELEIIINGGIDTIPAIQTHLQHVDGVMLGRKAYHDPRFLQTLEQALYQTIPLDIKLILEKMLHYLDREVAEGTAIHHISRHLQGLFHAIPGAKRLRKEINTRPLETLQQLVLLGEEWGEGAILL